MKAVLSSILLSVLLFFAAFPAVAQHDAGTLLKRMRQYEDSILKSYLEYQKLYYEDKSRAHELAAFEELLSVYIDQVMEMYETLSLSQRQTEEPRDIAARALIFKALMFLEKAPLNVGYFEKACYEYYQALSLYDGTDAVPVIYKELPKEIRTGNETFFRLVDLLEAKGQELKHFGKVKLTFRHFTVTADFDPEKLELVKFREAAPSRYTHTFSLAEARIKQAFAEVFRKSREVETYIALPEGTYLLRLQSARRFSNSALTRFYVRPNQEQHYIMEPLADWIILYEEPLSKRPDYYRFRRNKEGLAADQLPSLFDHQATTDGVPGPQKTDGTLSSTGEEQHQALVAEIVAAYLPQFKVKVMFDLNDPEIQDNSVQILARTIVDYVESPEYYNRWSQWTAAWEIAKRVRDVVSPGSLVPVPLVKLIFKVLNEL